jgi:hypothetical protein
VSFCWIECLTRISPIVANYILGKPRNQLVIICAGLSWFSGLKTAELIGKTMRNKSLAGAHVSEAIQYRRLTGNCGLEHFSPGLVLIGGIA